MERIKTVLIGLNFGGHILNTHLMTGCGVEYLDTIGVCDLNPEKVETVAEKFGIKGYYDLQEVLDDPQVEAVVLMCGPNERPGLIRRIINAGKHVMTTKPFGLDPQEAADVLAEAKKLGRIVHLNSPTSVVSDDFEKIDEWRDSYNLGKLVAARFECYYWAVQQADGSWYDDPEKCPVAPMFRLGIYGINDLVRLFGKPVSLQVSQANMFGTKPTPDLAMMMVQFEGGQIAELLCGWCIRPMRNVDSLTLYFENGTVYRNPPLFPGSNPETYGDTKLVLTAGNEQTGCPADPGGEPTEIYTTKSASHAYRYDVFQKLIRGEPVENLLDPQTIVNGVAVMNAMLEAQRHGQVRGINVPTVV